MAKKSSISFIVDSFGDGERTVLCFLRPYPSLHCIKGFDHMESKNTQGLQIVWCLVKPHSPFYDFFHN